MGKETDIEKLTRAETDKLFVHTETQLNYLNSHSSMRKDTFERLVWLEAQREQLCGAPAPSRR